MIGALTTTRWLRSLGIRVSIAFFALVVVAAPAAAQSVQPTAEQMRMINQLPPEQRRQALNALRDVQSQQQESSNNKTPTESQDTGVTRDSESAWNNTQRSGAFESPRAQADTSLVITLTPKVSLTDNELDEIDDDPALRRIKGSHYYELDESGVLLLPGLPDVPLLGLGKDAIVARLGAEAALSPFDVNVSILDSESIGAAALEPFGYGLFDAEGSEFSHDTSGTALSGPVPSDYLLGPGDVVRVQLFGNVNTSYELEVSRDGTLSLPELGPMNVTGLRFSELRDRLNDTVQQKLIGTQVSVSLGSLRSVRVFTVGDVNRPGSYVVSSLATISSALYRSGGISRVGTLRDVQLKRQGRVVAHLDLYDLLLNGDTSNDEQLQQGDVIFVPPIGPTIGIGGAVQRPAIYEAKGALSLSDALSMAGGLSPDAYRDGSTLIRIGDDRERNALSVDLSSPADSSRIVQNGDTLMVPRVLPELTRTVTLKGHVLRSGPREWHDGMRLTDLIPNLNMLSPGADENYILIRREKMPGRRIQVLSADLSAAMAYPASPSNVHLESRDSVYVFDMAFGRQRVITPILAELRLYAAFDSPYREVGISGSVRAPGDYPMEPGMRVSDLVRAGGSLSESAYTEAAELTRFTVVDGEYRQKEVIEVNLHAALAGDKEADLVLSSYDQLRVNRVPDWNSDWTVDIEGEVRFPGTYQVRRGETLDSVLKRAGGLTDLAFPEGAIFLREDLREKEEEQLEALARRIESDLASTSLESRESSGTNALTVGQTLLDQLRNTEPVGRLVIDLERVLAAESRRHAIVAVELKDGDRLLVPSRSQEVTVLGEAQYPTSHLYRKDLTRDDYISFSGGLTRKADKGLIYVVRANGAVVTGGNRSNWFRRSRDTEIRPGDTIVIPLETDRVRPLTFWTNVSQIFYQTAIAVAAIRTFEN